MSKESNDNPLRFVFRPPGTPRPPQNRNLTRSDVTNQGRVLMAQFIHDRMAADGYRHPLNDEELIARDTPSGPPVHQLREVAGALRRIGDELDGDAHLQRLIKKIPPDAPRQTFLNVARELFADGNFNWGRVVTLFYFAYKMICKAIQAALDQIPFLRGILECVVDILYENVSPWIVERGGWEAIFEYFGSTNYQVMGVIAAGLVLTAAFVLYRYYKS